MTDSRGAARHPRGPPPVSIARRTPIEPESQAPLTDEQLAILCGRAAHEQRARDVVVMDMRKVMPLCDYFVLTTGSSKRQMQTVADSAREALAPHGVRPMGVEGYNEAHWILLDFGSIVMHVFGAEARAYYDLELLWGDTDRIQWQP